MGLRTLIKKIFNGGDASRKIIKEWEKNGKPVPPPHIIKQNAITHYHKKYNIDCLVETGTYMGDMVEAQRSRFKKIISIELDIALHNAAVQKFSQYNHIKVYQGDSGKILEEIAPGLNYPCLFWLDGHYSAGNTAKGELNTPILKELQSIFSKGVNHIVLIDDARLFIGKDDYPTLNELKQFMERISPGYNMEVKDDIIRFSK